MTCCTPSEKTCSVSLILVKKHSRKFTSLWRASVSIAPVLKIYAVLKIHRVFKTHRAKNWIHWQDLLNDGQWYLARGATGVWSSLTFRVAAAISTVMACVIRASTQKDKFDKALASGLRFLFELQPLYARMQ
jgi:hypothetical protein